MKEKLMYRIEQERRRLYEFASDKSLFDPEVVQLSQHLDRLLNEYNLGYGHSFI